MDLRNENINSKKKYDELYSQNYSEKLGNNERESLKTESSFYQEWHLPPLRPGVKAGLIKNSFSMTTKI